MKHRRNAQAASEILGEIILLAIAVTTISVLYTYALSLPEPTDIANVTIIGKMEGSCPVFKLQRGESLGPDTKIILTVGGCERRYYLYSEVSDQEWDIGEQIVLPVGDIKGIQIEAMIVDVKTNSIVFSGVLQKGFTTWRKGGIWHFDEAIWRTGVADEVQDSSGNNNHGVALNGAKIISGAAEPQNVKLNNSGFFDGFLDTVKVKTSWTLNITNQITIDAWMKPQIPDFISDIVGVSGTFGYTPYIIPVVGNIFAIVSEDFQKGGLLSTVEIDTEGTVTYHQNLTLGKSTGANICQPKIIQMTKNICLVSFIDNKYYVNLQTINISSNGSLAYMNQLVFTEKSSTNSPNRPSLAKITETLCAIAYWAPLSGGLLKTVEVSSTGKITDTGKTMQYDPVSTGVDSREPCLLHVTGNVYALAYRGPLNHGILKTFFITPEGNITDTGHMIEFDSTAGYEPSLVQVSKNVIAVAYRNTLSYGVVKTFSIFPDGSITWTGNMKVFENTTPCYNPCIIYGEEDMYLVVYATGDVHQSSNQGYVQTLRMQQDGTIDPTNGLRLQFEVPDGETCHYPVITNVAEELYAITYTGPIAHTGYLITILIGPHGRGIYKGDSYQLYANMTMVEGYINSVYITYSNTSLGLLWHHVVLTYDGITIRLYVDGNLVNETSYPYHRIDLTKSPLYFGRFYCGFIDEISIYDKALTQEQIHNHYLNPGMTD
ncbi:MAG: LamG domain-containing protein [Candidatus Thermoplasmatota archaeon]